MPPPQSRHASQLESLHDDRYMLHIHLHLPLLRFVTCLCPPCNLFHYHTRVLFGSHHWLDLIKCSWYSLIIDTGCGGVGHGQVGQVHLVLLGYAGDWGWSCGGRQSNSFVFFQTHSRTKSPSKIGLQTNFMCLNLLTIKNKNNSKSLRMNLNSDIFIITWRLMNRFYFEMFHLIHCHFHFYI